MPINIMFWLLIDSNLLLYRKFTRSELKGRTHWFSGSSLKSFKHTKLKPIRDRTRGAFQVGLSFAWFQKPNWASADPWNFYQDPAPKQRGSTDFLLRECVLPYISQIFLSFPVSLIIIKVNINNYFNRALLDKTEQ